MLITNIKKLYRKAYRDPRDWVQEYLLPNINSAKKMSRLFQWTVLPKYRKMPPFIIIDPIVKCNVDCPLCSIPPKTLPHYGSKLSFEDFQIIFEKIKDATNQIYFCHAGEPFLNKELLDMVKLVSDADMISMVGTNGTLFNEKNIEKIFTSGLDFLQISFDGFSKETYEKYRVGANFEKVMEGIRQLAEKKKVLKSRKPFIELTFLINAYNIHEINAADQYFSSLGIRFRTKQTNLNVHRRLDGKTKEELSKWIPFNTRYSMYEMKTDGTIVNKEPIRNKCATCLKPVVNCKGEILLCCHDIYKTIDLGNIKDVNFKQMWNSPQYTKLREQAAKRKLPLCKKCGI